MDHLEPGTMLRAKSTLHGVECNIRLSKGEFVAWLWSEERDLYHTKHRLLMSTGQLCSVVFNKDGAINLDSFFEEVRQC